MRSMGLKEDGTEPTKDEERLPKRLVFSRWSTLLMQIEDQSSSVTAARETVANDLSQRVDARVAAARGLDAARKAGVLGKFALSPAVAFESLRNDSFVFVA